MITDINDILESKSTTTFMPRCAVTCTPVIAVCSPRRRVRWSTTRVASAAASRRRRRVHFRWTRTRQSRSCGLRRRRPRDCSEPTDTNQATQNPRPSISRSNSSSRSSELPPLRVVCSTSKSSIYTQLLRGVGSPTVAVSRADVPSLAAPDFGRHCLWRACEVGHPGLLAAGPAGRTPQEDRHAAPAGRPAHPLAGSWPTLHGSAVSTGWLTLSACETMVIVAKQVSAVYSVV